MRLRALDLCALTLTATTWLKAVIGERFATLVSRKPLIDIEVHRFGKELDMPICKHEKRSAGVGAAKGDVVVVSIENETVEADA